MTENNLYTEMTLPLSFVDKFGTILKSKVGEDSVEIHFFHLYFNCLNMPVEISKADNYVLHVGLFERRYPITTIGKKELSLLLPSDVVLFMEAACDRERILGKSIV